MSGESSTNLANENPTLPVQEAEAEAGPTPSTVDVRPCRQVQRKPKMKKKGGEDETSAEKIGNPGKFHGAKLKFLESQLPVYFASKGRGGITEYFEKLFGMWWALFPWYSGYGPDGHPLPQAEMQAAEAAESRALADELLRGVGIGGSEAPDTPNNNGAPDAAPDATPDATPDVAPDAAAHAAPDVPPNVPSPNNDVPLPNNDAPPPNNDAPAASASTRPYADTGGVDPKYKITIKVEVTAQVKTWFSHKKTTANRAGKNPFVDWLKGFKHPPPVPLYKWYMGQEEYGELVDARFNEKCKCARELLAKEDEEAMAELVAKQEVEHQEALASYKARIERVSNPDTPDPEKREAYCLNLAQVAQPFLDGIAKLTGLHVTLLAGEGPPPDSEKYVLTSLHSGHTVSIGGVEGQKFHEWDSVGFKRHVMGQFMKFLGETNAHSATWEVPGTGGVAWSGAPAMRPSASTCVSSSGGVIDVDDGGVGGGGDEAGAIRTAEPEPAAPERGRRKKATGRKRSYRLEETPSPSGPASPVLPTSHVLMVDMEKKLAAMPTAEQRAQLARLGGLHVSDFTQENTLVRNAAMMKVLDLDHALRGLIQPTLPVRPKPRPKPRDAGPPRKSMRLAGGKTIEGDKGGGAHGGGKGKGNEADGGGARGGDKGGGARSRGNEGGGADGGGAREGDELGGSHGEPSAASVDRVSEHEKQWERALEEERREREELERGKELEREKELEHEESGGEKESEHEREQGRTIDPVGSVDKTGWPTWMQNGHTLVSACRGDKWDSVVETWIALEKAYGFQTSAAAMPTTDRPAEVGQWIKYGRSTTRKTIVKISMLWSNWWSWWSTLALSWREKDEEGKPVVHEDQEVGDWGALVHPSGNGMLVVLLPLVWWRTEEGGDVPTDTWVAAVRNVTRVLKGLLSTAKSKTRKSPDTASAEGAERPRKCVRHGSNAHGSQYTHTPTLGPMPLRVAHAGGVRVRWGEHGLGRGGELAWAGRGRRGGGVYPAFPGQGQGQDERELAARMGGLSTGGPGAVSYPALARHMSSHQRTQGYIPGTWGSALPPAALLLPNTGMGTGAGMGTGPARGAGRCTGGRRVERDGGVFDVREREREQQRERELAATRAAVGRTEAAEAERGRQLRTVVLLHAMLPRFLAITGANSARNLEMCGLLLGREVVRGVGAGAGAPGAKSRYVVKTLLVPKQHTTSDTCTMDEEEGVLGFTKARGLIMLGWYWGWVKYCFREEDKPKFEDAKQAAIKYLDACTTEIIWRFVNWTWRWMDAYRSGLTGAAAAWAIGHQSAHRQASKRAAAALDASAVSAGSSFQRMLPESFTVVCAPKSDPNFGIFRLTDPPGLQTVLKCTAKQAFHPHPDVPIYTDADRGHVQMRDAALEIVDLR
ncbi:hypothetical protein B0H17DRAFT_1330545 [Mycena rosella]|uniref:Uncharacterized protein n=1 Tax=Mycena rosella TaxID=1033263 RepID=A0AAD7DLT9_MYCRO|nr:hypothetical protein B0H17DRAFT_1330545 [Mycena rosella]